MTKKNSLLNFVNIVNILVEPWTNNRIKEYESLFSQLKTNREKVAVMLLSIFFQIPKISIRSTKILSEKCHISINEVPNSLPQIVFNCLFRLIPVLSVKKDMTYTKVALICASSLPKSQLHFLFEVLLKYPEFHLAQSVYSILFERDPTLSSFLADNFDKCESILPFAFSSLGLQPFPNNFILKIASLFLSGKIQTTSSFFYSFCFYINRNIFPIDFETTDYFVLTLFQKIESFYAPHSHSYLFHLISKMLNDYPLPFISIHLFFQDFDENQIKSVFTTLIKENSSIKSFFVLSQIVCSEKLKELYSIATCTRFCTYTAMKKNIFFFKRSLEKIVSLHFELRVLSKTLEIASIPEFQDISFDFLEIFAPFTSTASAMSDILKIFFTRDKKLVSNLISKNTETKSSILTALYLLGNSPIAANPKLKTRYKSLAKAIIPRLNISGLQVNCLMPKSLSTTLTKKNLSNEELVNFYYNLTVKQIKPAPFKVENAINIISLFQISKDELGYEIRDNPEVQPDLIDSIKGSQYEETDKTQANITENDKNASLHLHELDENNLLGNNSNLQSNKPEENTSNLTANKPEENNSSLQSNQTEEKNSKPKQNNTNLKLNKNSSNSPKLTKKESNPNTKLQNNSNLRLNKTNSSATKLSKKESNSKFNSNLKSNKLEKTSSNLKSNKVTKTTSNPKLNKFESSESKKKNIKKVISSSIDIGTNNNDKENLSMQSEVLAEVEPKTKNEINHNYQIQSSIIDNIEKKPTDLVVGSSIVEDIEQANKVLDFEHSVIDDIEQKSHDYEIENSVVEDIKEKQQNLVFESSLVEDIEQKNVQNLAIESSVIDDVKEKIRKMMIFSTVVSSINPTEKKETGKESPKLIIISSLIADEEPRNQTEKAKKEIKLEFLSSVISSIKPKVEVQNLDKKKYDQKAFNLSIQSSIVTSIAPAQKQFNLDIQSSIVSDIKPKERSKFQLVTIQLVSEEKQQKIVLEKTVLSTVFSITPAKTSEQIELEKLQQIPISKYNISTQVSLINNQKKAKLNLSERSITTEKVLPVTNNSVCYNASNNFESNLLSDDNLSSSELLDNEELVKKPSTEKSQKSNNIINQNQSKKILKNSENKNQKSLKNSENKNQKQLKISNINNKNQAQKKNANMHLPSKDKSNELIKSHSFSVSSAKQEKNEEKVTTTKPKVYPNIPKPASDANKKAVNNKILNSDKSDDIPPITRPKSMNNMVIESDENVDISSDDIGFALPSDDYDFNDSKSSYSISGISDIDENELNQMFGDDEQVQMFADMLLPPDK